MTAKQKPVAYIDGKYIFAVKVVVREPHLPALKSVTSGRKNYDNSKRQSITV